MEQQALIANTTNHSPAVQLLEDDDGSNPFGDLVELEDSEPVCATPPLGWCRTAWPGIYRRRKTGTLALVRESLDEEGRRWRHLYLRVSRFEGEAFAQALAATFLDDPDESWMCPAHPDPDRADRLVVRFHFCAQDPWASPRREWANAAALRGVMAPKGLVPDI